MGSRTVAALLALAALASCAMQRMAEPFPIDRVELDPASELAAARDRDLEYLLSLDSRRLLCTHTRAAGVDMDCEEYRHQPYFEHFLGHWLSAAALMARGTANKTLAAKSAAIVSRLRECQDAWTRAGEEGYLFAHARDAIDAMEATALRVNDTKCHGYWAGLPVSVPYYNVHKTLAGLIDQHELLGNEEALDVAVALAGWIARHVRGFVADHGEAGWQRVMCEEWGGMNDALYNLYAITGDKELLWLADAFEKSHMTVPLAAGRDTLTNMHANTHIPQMIGAARGYEETGNETKLTVARNFWKLVTETRSWATGGSNDHEWWSHPHRLADDLDDQTEESCTQYNMLKLARIFFTWSADATLADWYERAIINGIWGNQHHDHHQFIYMLPLGPAGQKPWGDAYDEFPCCWGTLSESFAKLADSAYFRSSDNSVLYVNQFLATKLDWQEAGVHLWQETNFPYSSKTTFTVSKTSNAAWTLAIRVPSWAKSGHNDIKVNGVLWTGVVHPGSYARINRVWSAGDKVEASFPMTLWTQHINDDRKEFASLHAVMYGPMVLVGLTSNNVLNVSPELVPTWLSRTSETGLLFEARDIHGWVLSFHPLYQIMDEKYTTYFMMVGKQ